MVVSHKELRSLSLSSTALVSARKSTTQLAERLHPVSPVRKMASVLRHSELWETVKYFLILGNWESVEDLADSCWCCLNNLGIGILKNTTQWGVCILLLFSITFMVDGAGWGTG